MKKLLSMAALFLACAAGVLAQSANYPGSSSGTSSGGATILPQLVQTPGTGAAFASVTTSPLVFTSSNRAGDVLVAMVQMSVGSSGNTVSISDTQGDTWYQAGLADIGISYVFYAVAKGGANTVTASFSGSSSGIWFLAEYSGVSSSHPMLVGNEPNGSGAGFLPNTRIITPVPGSLIIVIAGNNGGGNTYGAFVGCTPRSPLVNVAAFWCDNNNSLAGDNFYNFEQAGGSIDIISKAVAFLPASYKPPAYPTVVRQTEGASSTPGQIKTFLSTPLTDVFTGGNQAGDIIVASVIQNGANNFITSIGDTEGNTYTVQAGGGNLADSSNHLYYLDYCAPVTVGGLTNNTVTVNLSAGTGTVFAVEVANASCTQDANATGTGAYNFAVNTIGDFILTMNGYSGGGTVFSGLSGFDASGIPSTSNVQLNVNYFVSCAKNNAITSYIPATSGTDASFSIALLPTGTSLSCPAVNVSSNQPSITTANVGEFVGVSTGSSAMTALGTGACTASSTLALYPLGNLTTQTCTGTTLTNGQTLQQPELIQGMVILAGTGGVNSSSGVVTLYVNGVASPITCTIGTATSCVDYAHPTAFGAGSVVAVRLTTQASETLASVSAYINLVPLGPFPLGVQ